MSFVMTSATCPNLPPGTTIEGSGTKKSITIVKTDKNGVTTIENTTHATGRRRIRPATPTCFNYANDFRISNSAANPGVFSGRMTDAFSLAGSGPAQPEQRIPGDLHDRLRHVASFEELNSRGDPLDFATATARCDPL